MQISNTWVDTDYPWYTQTTLSNSQASQPHVLFNELLHRTRPFGSSPVAIVDVHVNVHILLPYFIKLN